MAVLNPDRSHHPLSRKNVVSARGTDLDLYNGEHFTFATVPVDFPIGLTELNLNNSDKLRIVGVTMQTTLLAGLPPAARIRIDGGGFGILPNNVADLVGVNANALCFIQRFYPVDGVVLNEQDSVIVTVSGGVVSAATILFLCTPPMEGEVNNARGGRWRDDPPLRVEVSK